jgi:hypothetical protein
LAGHGQIVAAVAEPGVGQSRLFYEFKVKNQSGWMVLEALSVSYGKASAYLPIIDLLHLYFGIELADDARRRREKVKAEIVKWARLCCREGADSIKLNVSGDNLYRAAKAEMTVMSEAEIRAGVEVAHAFHCKVNSHCRAAESVKRAVRCDVDVIYHCDKTRSTHSTRRAAPLRLSGPRCRSPR